jgi:asparagine synthase (glutamine-hydrolysing)
VSEFAGIVRFDQGTVDEADVTRLKRSLFGAGDARTWRPSPSVALIERRGVRVHDNGSPAAPIQIRPDIFQLISTRLDSPATMAAALGMSTGAGLADDRTLVSAACTRWGVLGTAKRLYGDLACIEWNENDRRLTIGRCALGARPVYYVERPWGLIFATTLQSLMVLPDVPRDLDDEMIAHHLTLAMQDRERTLYRHIRRAPPGAVMTFDRRGKSVEHYFTAEQIRPVRLRSDDDYVEAARDLLDQAVRYRIPADGILATKLSGGFDSSGVTATLARIAGDREVRAFTRAPAFDHPYDMDEVALAKLVVERYPNIRWTVVDDDREHIRDIEPETEAGALLVPRRSSFNTTWFESLALAAKAQGIDTIFGGGTGNSTLSYATNPDIVDSLAHSGLGDALGDLRLRARELKQGVIRTALGQMYRRYAPRAIKRMRLRDRPWLAYSLISPDFLGEVDYDRLGRETGHDVPFTPRGTVTELRLSMLQGQAGRDFVGHSRRTGGLAQRDPYSDRAMVEFTLGIPLSQYWHKGTNRWLARRVLADRVPAELLEHRRRGKQSPEWYVLATRRHAGMVEAVERIARSRLASRTLDIPRMRQILAEWPADAETARQHESLYGHGLQRAIALGGFLRWHEGSNE